MSTCTTYLDINLVVKRRNSDCPAKKRLAQSNRDVQVNIVFLANKIGVRGNLREELAH